MKFQINQQYNMNWINDSNAKTIWFVIKRTKCTVTMVSDTNETVTRRIFIDSNGDECIKPFGNYSMAPIVSSYAKI